MQDNAADRSRSLQEQKRALRRQAGALRRQVTDRDARSQQILQQVAQSDWLRQARSVLFYVATPTEVQTRGLLLETLARGLRVVVPYCEAGQLRLVLVASIEELTPGAYGILEPTANLRTDPLRTVAPEEIDLALIPGVAFDRSGRRLGQGQGFYDRLLAQLRPDCITVGLAFACQIVEQIPTEPHDIALHHIVTELSHR